MDLVGTQVQVMANWGHIWLKPQPLSSSKIFVLTRKLLLHMPYLAGATNNNSFTGMV